MNNSEHRYFMINKPYDMVSQFVSSHKVRLLGDLGYSFPEGTHAVGRLDNHSEGLLILTTNKKLTRLLFQSDVPHQRSYLVQVNNTVSAASLQLLQEGVTIRIKEGRYYQTPACEVNIVPDPNLFPAYPLVPGEERAERSWLLIRLTEGKYHQVRKMVGAVRHRCKRLIRVAIEGLELGELPPGAVRELDEAVLFRLLKIDP
jgi:23S rRNA pseudouridine2457 synthase